MDLQHIARTLGKEAKKHAPTVLTIIGTIGVGATTYLAARGGYRSAESLIVYRAMHGEESLTPKEKVSAVWKHYIPAASTGFTTVALMITANTISVKRQAALIGAYAISERFLTAYKDKMIEQLGVDGEQQARAEILRDTAAESYPQEISHIPEGKSIFLDSLSGQYFPSDVETVRKAMNDTNQKCINEGYSSMNYFYSLIGARRTKIGEVIGWNTDRMLDVVITEGLTTEGGQACVGLDYREQPTMEYHRVW